MKNKFLLAAIFALTISVFSCTPEALTELSHPQQDTGGEEHNDPVDPDNPEGDD